MQPARSIIPQSNRAAMAIPASMPHQCKSNPRRQDKCGDSQLPSFLTLILRAFVATRQRRQSAAILVCIHLQHVRSRPGHLSSWFHFRVIIVLPDRPYNIFNFAGHELTVILGTYSQQPTEYEGKNR